MSSFLRKMFLGSVLILVAAFIGLATRPVMGGNYLTLAALKDIFKSPTITLFSKKEMMQSFLKIDIAERLSGRDNVKTCQVGEYSFAVQHAAIAKNLLIDVFIRQDYYFPYQATNPFIIDCGANVGFTTAYFKFRYPDATIFAFEPDPINFSLLEKNMATAKFKNVVLHKKAVAAVAEELNFGGAGTTSSLMHDSEASDNMIKVEAVTLSSYIDKPVDILKMDIEGAESQVLKELDTTNKISFVKNIIMEFHYTASNPNALGAILTMLERRNFQYHIKSVSGMTQDFNCHERVSKTLNCLMIYAYQI